MPHYPRTNQSKIDDRWTTYHNRPYYLFNRHLETIIPSVFFKTDDVPFEREQLDLEDGDFLDIDWLKSGAKTLIVLSHGLEGSTDRYYIRRCAQYFFQKGFDVLAWNNRGCSGRMNKKPRFYHHGDISDISEVIQHGLQSGDYQKVFLIGFSMGGSHVTRYLCSENADHPEVIGGVAFSVSCDMKDSTEELDKPQNAVYKNRFLDKIKKKAIRMQEAFPGILSSEINEISDFYHFHEEVTVPANGFKDVNEFFYKASPANFLPALYKPLFMVNALNDPILGPRCYPTEHAQSMKHFYLYTPRFGGHLGFNLHAQSHSYMEVIAEEFLRYLEN